MRFLSSLLYIIVGAIFSAWLLNALFEADLSWVIILIPMMLMVLFVTAIGIVHLWLLLSERMMKSSGLLLSTRQMLWLSLKCWAVIVMGVALVVTFRWMWALLSDSVRQLVPWLEVLFYVFCALLTVAALWSILLGQNFHEIRLLNAQNENRLLKAQLNPHFLYNTLNNIDALIWLDQDRASRAVGNLSDLMRYLTYASRQESVSLDEEQQHLSQLVALQRLRMPVDDALQWTPEVENPQARIAPLLIMPLVENCFKHCGNLNESGAIRLSLSERDGILRFRSDNNLPSAPPSHSGSHGLGLNTLRRRLELLYPDNYSLSVGPTGKGRYETELQIRI